MKTHQKHLSTLFAIAALLGGTSQGFAATIAPSLGTASNFVVLGGAGVTCTASAVSGDVGSLVTVTGFPTPAPALCTLAGTVHSVDAAATTAFATSTNVLLGVAMNVVRIMLLRYSPVTVIAARTISTGTPNTATPVAAFSDGSGAAPYAVDPCSAARPMLSTATAAAVHSTDRVVDSLIRSASATATALTG